MDNAKITITLPKKQLEEIRAQVAGGSVPSVSGYVRTAVEKALSGDEEFLRWLDEGFEATGGPPTPAERAWADSVISSQKNAVRGGRVAKAA